MKNLKILAIAALAVFSTQIVLANLNSRECNKHIPVKLATEGFLEIEVSTLPKEVQEAITTKFEGSEISKAYVNKEGVYKLELTNENAQNTIYMNAKGELVEL